MEPIIFMNHDARRRAAAIKRTTIRKRQPFGRIAVLAIESGDKPQDDRIVYRHTTKGIVDRRTTTQFLDSLLLVA